MVKKTNPLKLSRGDFKEFQGNANYYSKILGTHNEYELSLIPCEFGFDVSLHVKKPEYVMRQVGEPVCTKFVMTAEQRIGQIARSDEVWDKAVILAQEMIDKHVPVGIER